MIKEKFLTIEKKFKEGSKSYIQYNYQIERLYSYIQEKIGASTEEKIIMATDTEMVEEFYIALEAKGFKKSTLNTAMACLKEYYSYLHAKRHMLQYNPTDILNKYSKKIVQIDTKEKEVLSANEIKQIIKCTYDRCDERDFKFNSARNRFLVALLFTTGLRIEEALNIQESWLEEISPEKIVINIPAEYVKNKMNKRVPITNYNYYKEYLEQRSRKNASDYLFISKTGKKLSTSAVNQILGKIVPKAGIDKHISAHVFRHSCTKALVSNNIEETLIKKVLGWTERSSDMLSVYAGGADNPIYDEKKFEICNLLG